MRALVIGSSGGIGQALVQALETRPDFDEVTGLSRRDHGLDFRHPESIPRAFEPLRGPYHLILVASGVLHGAGQAPEKSLSALSAAAMADQFAVNAIGPAMVLQQAVPLLPRRERAVFAALSARVGSIGDNRLGGWYSYRAAKAGLNQVIHSAAIELARSHPQAICAALHPGTVATSFTASYQSRHPTVDPIVAAQNLLRVAMGLQRDQSGGFFDWRGDEIPW
ncbi:MAG: SDR family NAD(P)-dependent oxidoreductase [Mangrovicoccus sp.]|nr:SDR family NAD(P)-dependent oxidoreductase [Mangrovicoccus sp.]